MEKTWRWFGKKDKITLDMLRQIGVEGIVTALHDVPNGEIWTEEAINDLKTYIESYGLRWSVVESLPVCEAIKYAGPEREQLIENYKISLANLGKCGVNTVCYNFMPVIDWIRTDLQHPWADGTSSLYFDRVRFAYFDLRILQREGAEKDYSAEELAKVAELDKTITEAEKDSLVDAIIVKTQGFVNGNIKEGDKNPVNIFRNLLALYKASRFLNIFTGFLSPSLMLPFTNPCVFTIIASTRLSFSASVMVLSSSATLASSSAE